MSSQISDEHGMLRKITVLWFYLWILAVNLCPTGILPALPFLGSDKAFVLPKLCVFASLGLHFE